MKSEGERIRELQATVGGLRGELAHSRAALEARGDPLIVDAEDLELIQLALARHHAGVINDAIQSEHADVVDEVGTPSLFAAATKRERDSVVPKIQALMIQLAEARRRLGT